MMKVYFLRAALIAMILVGWQVGSPIFGWEFFVSTPSLIARRLFEMVKDGSLFVNMAITLYEAGLGFLLGGSLGFVVGILLGRSQLLADVLSPFLQAFYSLPKAALAPLFILWFGIGISMKVILAASIVFFIVFLNTFTAAREVSPELVAIVRLMRASGRDVLTKIVIPSATVWVFVGLRLSVPYALIGAIVGEIIASNRGLGYLLAYAAGRFDTAGTFAALFSIIILSLILNQLVLLAERRLMPWRSAEVRQEVSV
jgi:NitT/TauT family transport system permease protein